MPLPRDITSITNALITERPKPVKISTSKDVNAHKTKDKIANTEETMHNIFLYFSCFSAKVVFTYNEQKF